MKKRVNKKCRRGEVVGPETDLLHRDFDSRRSEGSFSVPLFTTSTFVFPSAEYGKMAFKAVLNGDHNHFLIYRRLEHPNSQILQNRISKYEPGGGSAAAFTTGMAAIHTTISALLKLGQEIIVSHTVYGGTYCLLKEYFIKHGVAVKFVDTTDLTATAKVIKKSGKNLGIVFMESPANPSMRFTDIATVAKLAKHANPNCVVVVDNTFMGIFQHPFKVSQDIDLVVYSATKFLGGHSNLTGGIVIARQGRSNLMKAIKGLRIVFGNIIDPFSAHQLLTQIDTYDLRMQDLARRATKIANYLSKHPKVIEVRHPSLLKPSELDYPIFQSQCSGPGSVISFWLRKVNTKTAFQFENAATKSGVISLAVSLGCVETLMTHPSTTTHSEMSHKDQVLSDITPNLIRISVGRENPEDIINALEQGFQAI